MDDKQVLFEQYKLAVEMADRVSARREGANKIFLTANSIVFAFLATQSIFSEIHIFIAVFGIFLCFVWAEIIKNYRTLNSAKFAIIHEMEEKLPWKVYKDEWARLKQGKDKKTHSKLTVTEKQLPWVFLVFYTFLFIYVAVSFF
ncbi:MAG: hypothetical protein COU46_02320 [Candidatus Niyogibacteria bacterium CG10_big_fil_rev_8_21_14_0_10_42_19]|uniref:SMODS and SLOG-associating 2TM effector domain-containing protein n=1 Tax=Candidatus Niyogibacteria bacterium CG10_big_fil_rev_8_21_14_0_10_42_19 TaxID=1974725 RepID=A0A2H0TFD5_9BACT|nr:MAG: hypothetical protein COU46_02320 [Candidatus Niyogibacteria bacterium CG10_big_fil_rev_8_21_14_0_10_42_19]